MAFKKIIIFFVFDGYLPKISTHSQTLNLMVDLMVLEYRKYFCTNAKQSKTMAPWLLFGCLLIDEQRKKKRGRCTGRNE